MAKATICVDIWAGESHMDHIARYLLPMPEAFNLARLELDQGNLVNLRTEVVWGA